MNDFKKTLAVVDYKRFPQVKILDAFIVPHENDDKKPCITIFLNYKIVGQFSKKQEAKDFVWKLVRTHKEVEEFVGENVEYLLKGL